MTMKFILILQIAFISLCSVRASKILMLLPIGSRSHKNIFTPLAERLGANGHDVTIVSMNKEMGNRSLPYNDIELPKMTDHIKRLTGDFNVFNLMKGGDQKNVNFKIMKIMVNHLPNFCESFLNDPNMEPVWNVRPDLLLIPAFMNECGLILVKKFQVPFIYVTTSGLTPWTADLVGNPEHPAYVPNQYLPYRDDMNLLQRTVNSIFRVLTPFLRRKYILEPLDLVAQKFLRDPTVSLADVEKNVSLVLVNSHHSLGFPRPLQPNVIEIGGMHCRKAQNIVDPELNQFLNSSKKNGVILFSLGSHIRSSQMPDSFRDLLVRAFSRLPYNIIWKWEGSEIPNLSSNVLLKNWVPQQDVLGHPSVGGFFTHGGLLSTQEAIFHGVPMVGLPLISDQHLNMKQAESTGIAIKLELQTITEDQVVKSLKDIMEKSSFRRTVQERSRVMKDQETTPLDRATYYTEYVIRHQGAKHLRSTSASLSSMSYYLLDVVGLVIFSLTLTLAVLYTLLITAKFVFRKTRSRYSELRNEAINSPK